MVSKMKVAVIGLDTSHSVEFPKIIQSPELPDDKKVHGLKVTSCFRLETPFQNKEGLDKRQKELEKIGIKVTENFDEAVADCDAIMIEFNDASYHLDYFNRCAALGKPIFLDKPLANSHANGKKILDTVTKNNIRFMSSSPLRFDRDVVNATSKVGNPDAAVIWGPIGNAPSGSSIIWYGVHAFEMLQKAMGCGAAAVTAVSDKAGYVFHISYADGRRGIVDLTSSYRYGGVLRKYSGTEEFFTVTGGAAFYLETMREVEKFFLGGNPPLKLDDTNEVMSMLDAADRSATHGGKTEVVYK